MIGLEIVGPLHMNLLILRDSYIIKVNSDILPGDDTICKNRFSEIFVIHTPIGF